MVVPRVPLVTPPRPRTLGVCEELVPLPRVDPIGTVVFLRIPRPRVGVLLATRFAASSFCFSAASMAF